MKKLLPLFLLFLATSVFAQKAPQAYSPEVTKAFAFDLYQNGFYQEAESEFLRYLYTSSQVDETALLTLATIYNNENNLSGINWICNNFLEDLKNSTKPGTEIKLGTEEKLFLSQGRMIFKTGDRGGFSDFKTKLNPSLDSYSLDFKNIIVLSDLILNLNFSEAKNLALEATSNNQTFADLSNSLNEYKLKKPGLGLFLSMICPGAGKWYSGSFSQGLSSFLSVGGFAAATVYTGIESQWKSWRPYVFGTCGLVLWITDIYGAYQASKRYNATLYRELCETTETVYETLF